MGERRALLFFSEALSTGLSTDFAELSTAISSESITMPLIYSKEFLPLLHAKDIRGREIQKGLTYWSVG